VVYTADSIRKFDSKSNRIRDSIRTQKNDSQVPTDRVLKPHVQHHTNITPAGLSFAAPRGALNPIRVGKFCDFQPIHRRISETMRDKAILTLIH